MDPAQLGIIHTRATYLGPTTNQQVYIMNRFQTKNLSGTKFGAHLGFLVLANTNPSLLFSLRVLAVHISFVAVLYCKRARLCKLTLAVRRCVAMQMCVAVQDAVVAHSLSTSEHQLHEGLRRLLYLPSERGNSVGMQGDASTQHTRHPLQRGIGCN